MDPIVHRGRVITLHPRGTVALEVRIDDHFVMQVTRTAEEIVAEVRDIIDLVDAHPTATFITLPPHWFAADDPRRAEAKMFYGVPRYQPD